MKFTKRSSFFFVIRFQYKRPGKLIYFIIYKWPKEIFELHDWPILSNPFLWRAYLVELWIFVARCDFRKLQLLFFFSFSLKNCLLNWTAVSWPSASPFLLVTILFFRMCDHQKTSVWIMWIREKKICLHAYQWYPNSRMTIDLKCKFQSKGSKIPAQTYSKRQQTLPPTLGW